MESVGLNGYVSPFQVLGALGVELPDQLLHTEYVKSARMVTGYDFLDGYLDGGLRPGESLYVIGAEAHRTDGALLTAIHTMIRHPKLYTAFFTANDLHKFGERFSKLFAASAGRVMSHPEFRGAYVSQVTEVYRDGLVSLPIDYQEPDIIVVDGLDSLLADKPLDIAHRTIDQLKKIAGSHAFLIITSGMIINQQWGYIPCLKCGESDTVMGVFRDEVLQCYDIHFKRVRGEFYSDGDVPHVLAEIATGKVLTDSEQ